MYPEEVSSREEIATNNAMSVWKKRYWPSEICRTKDCITAGSKTEETEPPKILARVNKILRTLLKNQAKAEIEIIDLIFVPLVESLPSLSRTKKARANNAPTVMKLERTAENLLAVTSAEIISLYKSFGHKEIEEQEQRMQEQVIR